RQRIEMVSMVLAGICALALAFGTWRQISLFNHRDALLKKVQAAQEKVDANDALTTELLAEYEGYRPVFASQQNTLDTLKTLTLLQQTRSNRNFWYVLLSDQQTYFSQPPVNSTTNKLARTNLLAAVSARPNSALQTSTNLSPARPGFIAE